MKLTPLLAALVVALIPAVAFAQSSTTVVVPVGDWLSSVVPTIEALLTTVIGLAITWGLRFVPAAIRAFITQQQINQAEQLLANAIGYGINTVVGAEKGRNLEINVGNAVAAQAVQYAIDHGPSWLVGWMGGTEAIQQKIIARLPLVSGAPVQIVPPAPVAASSALTAPSAAAPAVAAAAQ
jgi:hypothetical protein